MTSQVTQTEVWQRRWDAALMGNYGTPQVVLARGEGATVWDVDGKQYVDLFAGLAVNVLGHGHPAVLEAVNRQLATLGHVSNLAVSQPAVLLAEKRKELTGYLRTRRTKRQPRAAGPISERRGRIPNMVKISERPPEADDRAVPGHWEGDLILGANNGSAIGTLVERSTRFVMLLHLPDGHRTEQVLAAMTAKIHTLPGELFRTVTWDQGSELAGHVEFSIATNIAVYFCDPHSPWQRGSNENTNGLLRQYFPKSTDLSVHSHADLDAVAAQLNDRPRKTLGWMKPWEKFAELVATAA